MPDEDEDAEADKTGDPDHAAGIVRPHGISRRLLRLRIPGAECSLGDVRRSGLGVAGCAVGGDTAVTPEVQAGHPITSPGGR